jgi:hypothetical protein
MRVWARVECDVRVWFCVGGCTGERRGWGEREMGFGYVVVICKGLVLGGDGGGEWRIVLSGLRRGGWGFSGGGLHAVSHGRCWLCSDVGCACESADVDVGIVLCCVVVQR